MEPLINASTLQARRDRSWVLLDARFDLANPEAGADAYRQSHIPGAFYAHLDRDLSGPPTTVTGRHPLPEGAQLAATLGQWGVGPDSTVVVYDDGSGAFAARAWWLLRWLGHQRVAVLNGGLKHWTAAGGPLCEQPVPLCDGPPYPLTGAHMPTWDADRVLANTATDEFALVDARAAARYAGEVEPIDPVAGHVPGALNRPFTDNLGADGGFKPAAALRREWDALLGGKPCAAMCGSGVTACHHVLALEIAGISQSPLYAGSWSEWIRDPDRPVSTA